MDMTKTATEIIEALNEANEKKPSAYDTTAEVIRVEGSTAWVHIPGGVDETPAALTIDAAAGDTVQIRVADGNAWLTGNQTAPPTADKTAKEALKIAAGAAKTVERGLVSDTLYYLASDQGSGVTVDTPGWSEEPQEITEALPYLWVYHLYTYADGRTETTEPCIVGVYGPQGDPGQDGQNGQDGQDGADGVSVSKVEPQYYLSTSSSSATDGSWQNSLPTYVSGRFYWTRDKITYSNGTTGYSTATYSPGLTQSVQLSYNTAQHFWTQPSSSATTTIPTGAYVTEQTESAYKSNPTGGATLIRSDKVDIRVGSATYSRFDGNGTKIYDGNGTADSNILGKFTAGEAQVGSGATGSGNTKIVANELSMNNGSTKQASLRYDTTPINVPWGGQIKSHRVVLAKAEEEKNIPNDATMSSRLISLWDMNTEPIAFVTAEHYETTSGTTKTAEATSYAIGPGAEVAWVKAGYDGSKSYAQLYAKNVDIQSSNYTLQTNGVINISNRPFGLFTDKILIKDNITIAANSFADGNASVASSYFQPLGVVGFSATNATSSGVGGAKAVIAHAYVDGTTAYYRVKNTGASQIKVKVEFNILYAPQV